MGGLTQFDKSQEFNGRVHRLSDKILESIEPDTDMIVIIAALNKVLGQFIIQIHIEDETDEDD